MNLGELRQGVMDRTATTIDDLLLDTSVLNRFINDALREVSNQREWSWLTLTTTITTEAGVSAYAVPSSFTSVLSITDDQGDPLQFVGPIDIEYLTNAYEGIPLFYTVTNSSILFAPTPTSVIVYTMRYSRSEDPLTSDTDSPFMPAHLHDAIIWYASHLAFRRRRDTTEAEAAFNSFKNALDRTHDDVTQSQKTAKLRRRSGHYI